MRGDGGGGRALGGVPSGSVTNSDILLAHGCAAFTKASDLLKNDVTSIDSDRKTNAQNSAMPCIGLTEDLRMEGGFKMELPALPCSEAISQEAECIDLTGSLSLQINNELSTPQPLAMKAYTYPHTPTMDSVSEPSTVAPTTSSASSHQVDKACTSDSTVSASREGGFVSAGTLLKGKGKMTSSGAASSATLRVRFLTMASQREPDRM